MVIFKRPSRRVHIKFLHTLHSGLHKHNGRIMKFRRHHKWGNSVQSIPFRFTKLHNNTSNAFAVFRHHPKAHASFNALFVRYFGADTFACTQLTRISLRDNSQTVYSLVNTDQPLEKPHNMLRNCFKLYSLLPTVK